jgi:hypothetical protein
MTAPRASVPEADTLDRSHGGHTFRAMTIRAALLAFSATLALAGPALAQATNAQAANKLEGTCERLVIAGQDHSAKCRGTLVNTVTRNRTSFDFSSDDGRSLSFSGNGNPQERTEESDALQPINLVIPGETTGEGVAQGPLVAVGACRFGVPSGGKTTIACEANAAKGRYEAVFVTDAKTAPGGPSN